MKGCLGCAGAIFCLFLLFGAFTIAKLAFRDMREWRDKRLAEKARQAEVQKAQEMENARIEEIDRKRKEAEAEAKRRQEEKDEKIRTFALKEAPKVWQVYQSLHGEIAAQSGKIEELRKTLVSFGKSPETDDDFKRICSYRDEMVRSHQAIRKRLEDAYIAKCKFDATPGRKDYADLHRKAIEDGIREANEAEIRFKEMRLNK